MKINYFYGSIAIRPDNGYTENLGFNITEGKGLTFRYPYGEATSEEAEAVSQFVKTVTSAYNKLTAQIDNVNKDLKLEQYAPIASSEASSSESADVSAAPQSCALGGGEVSTGALTMDEAKTPEEMLEVMIASGKRTEVRDLPM